jgi:hypothetical protein
MNFILGEKQFQVICEKSWKFGLRLILLRTPCLREAASAKAGELITPNYLRREKKGILSDEGGVLRRSKNRHGLGDPS